MATETRVEERLTAVEQAVSGLQEQLARLSSPADWLDRISGSLEHEPEFERVLEYGRVLRSASQPTRDAAEHV